MIASMLGWLATLPPWLSIPVAAYALWLVAVAGPMAWLGGIVAWMAAINNGWGPDGAIFAGLGAGIVVYIGACLIDPRGDCWWCKGNSKRRNSRGFFHMCLVCGGSGQRRRFGAKVLARHREDD